MSHRPSAANEVVHGIAPCHQLIWHNDLVRQVGEGGGGCLCVTIVVCWCCRQLNEIWPTGGWGSIEYGTPGTGQVLGGRWKPLHYFLRANGFSDMFAACGAGGQCLVKNDRAAQPFTGSVTVQSIEFRYRCVPQVCVRPWWW